MDQLDMSGFHNQDAFTRHPSPSLHTIPLFYDLI